MSHSSNEDTILCLLLSASEHQKWKENKNLSVTSAEVISTELPAEKHLEH